MNRLNPYDKVMRKAAQEQEARRKRARSGVVDAKRGVRIWTWVNFLGWLYNLNYFIVNLRQCWWMNLITIKLTDVEWQLYKCQWWRSIWLTEKSGNVIE